MTRNFFNRTVRFLFAIVLVQLPIAGRVAAQVIGVKVAAEFHDEIANSCSADGVNRFETRTTEKLIARLREMFAPERFAPADDDSELVLEIVVDPGDFGSRVADYAFWIHINRVQKGRKSTNVTYDLMEPDWQDVFPSSPEDASAEVVRSIIRLLGRRSADLRKELEAIRGRRLPVTMEITNLHNPGNLLNPDILVIELIRPFSRTAYTLPIDSGLFIDDIELPRIGRSYQANLQMEPRTGNNNANSGTITKLCLRAAARLTGTESLVELRCLYGGNCALKDSNGVKQWVRDCGRRSGWRWPGLIGTAQAQPVGANKRIWYAPSLSTLRERRRSGNIRGVGYTVLPCGLTSWRTSKQMRLPTKSLSMARQYISVGCRQGRRYNPLILNLVSSCSLVWKITIFEEFSWAVTS